MQGWVYSIQVRISLVGFGAGDVAVFRDFNLVFFAGEVAVFYLLGVGFLSSVF